MSKELKLELEGRLLELDGFINLKDSSGKWQLFAYDKFIFKEVVRCTYYMYSNETSFWTQASNSDIKRYRRNKQIKKYFKDKGEVL